MQDIEFTIERGKLWMLQTRTGKRTAKAALRIAVEMASEGLITQDEAVARVDPASLDQLLHPTLDPEGRAQDPGAPGLPASPGAAVRRDRVQLRRGRGRARRRAARSSWCASRPRPRTSTACTPPRAS